ncbi:uncharacterized protein TNCV_2005531 [Trichonephila clavipes]|nr:uncharacterized protein TNCV_2005531 [Trichonephila clavipes]
MDTANQALLERAKKTRFVTRSIELSTLDKETEGLIDIQGLEDEIVTHEEYRNKFITYSNRRAWYFPDDRHTASLVGLRGGWRHARTKLCFTLMDPMLLCPGKGLILPNLNIDQIATHTRFLLISLPNNDMSKISPFAIDKTLIGIGDEPKSVKRLRSRDLLIETTSALRTKSFFLGKSFLNNPVTISPHKTLNSCRGVISEPDLMGTPES